MKKMKFQTVLKSFTYFFFISLLALSACKKDKVEEEKGDYIRATIDGKPWEGYCDGIAGICISTRLTYIPSSGVFILIATNKDVSVTLSMTLNGVRDVGEYDIPTSISLGEVYYGDDDCEQWTFGTDPDKPAKLNITRLDTDKRVIEGSFYFTGVNFDTVCGDYPDIVVENGKFRMTYLL